ncbi:MAG: HAD-IA family hydrolase [Myxococcota bacterium]
MAPPLRAVLFDVTGTLIEPREDVGETYSRIAARHGVHASASRLGSGFRQALRDWPEQFFPDLSPDERAETERNRWHGILRQTFHAAGHFAVGTESGPVFQEIFDFYRRKEAWRLLPGARGTLQTARDLRLRIGVVSNFDHRLEALLQDIGIIEFLDVIAHPFRCGHGKPDPAIFQAALDQLDILAAHCLFVGHDPSRDLRAAEALGMPTFDAHLGLRPLAARIRGLASLDR